MGQNKKNDIFARKVPVVEFAKREFICLKALCTMFLIFPQYFIFEIEKAKSDYSDLLSFSTILFEFEEIFATKGQ
jgi:hypothetical protein